MIRQLAYFRLPPALFSLRFIAAFFFIIYFAD